MWNEEPAITAEHAARTVLVVLTERITSGEIERVRQLQPEPVREFWPNGASNH